MASNNKITSIYNDVPINSTDATISLSVPGRLNVEVVSFMIPYLIFTLCIGMYAGRNVTGMKGYVLANRNLPFFVTCTSMYAMFFGAEATLGASYNMAIGGLSGDVIADPYGACVCLFLYGIFYAYPLYKSDNLTLSDFYVERFGPKFGVFTAFINNIAYLMWTGGQIKALGLITEKTWGLDAGGGSIICTAIITFYTFRGGMVAVAYTEAFESVVIICCLIAVCLELGRNTDTTFLGAYSMYDEKMQPLVGSVEEGKFYGKFKAGLNIIAYWSYIGIGSIPSQDIYERMNSARKASWAVMACCTAAIVYIISAQMPMWIGLVVRKQYYTEVCGDPLGCELAIGSLAAEDESIVLDFLEKNVSRPVLVVFYAAFTSAILSTASGTVLGCSVLLSVNMIRPSFPNMTDEKLLFITRALTAVFALCAWAFTFAMDRISDFVNLSSVWLMMGMFWPLTAGIYWSRATSVGAALSGIGGVITYTTCYSISVTYQDLGHDSSGLELNDVDCLWYGMCVSFTLLLFGSLMPMPWQDAINRFMDKMLGWIPAFSKARAATIIKVGDMANDKQSDILPNWATNTDTSNQSNLPQSLHAMQQNPVQQPSMHTEYISPVPQAMYMAAMQMPPPMNVYQPMYFPHATHM